MVHVVLLYASILTVLFVVLSVRTLRMRRRLKIAVGDAGNLAMLRAMRVHSNFAEYVPFGLFLIFLVELTGAAPQFVHGLGSCLLAGRLSHAYGVSQVDEKYGYRVAGMALTFTTLLTAAAWLAYRYLAGL